MERDEVFEEAREREALYAKRAKLGRIALVLRTLFMQLVILGGMIVLARQLKPSEFGTFAMVQFVLSVFTLVGDAGLGGALVQKTETPSQNELSTVFYTQIGVGLVVFLIASVTAPLLRGFWVDLPEGSEWILRALAANFIFVSARVVPTLLLERELLFVRVAILDTINSVTFYLVASTLAILDYGTWALVLGVLAQGVFGFLTAIALRPWRPSLVFDRSVLGPLLRFGVPYQSRAGLTLLTRSSIPVLVGRALGSHSVGTMTWALETAFFPLTFIDILTRVSFPLLSRLRNNPEAFDRELERTLRMGVAITVFISSLFLGLGEPLTAIIYSEQWLEAVPELRWFAVAITFGMLPFLFSAAFDAIARPKIVLLQMTLAALLTWGLTALGLAHFGAYGFAVAYAIALTVAASVILAPAAHFFPKTRVLEPLVRALVVTTPLVLLEVFVLAGLVRGPLTLGLMAVLHLALFLGGLRLADRRTFALLWAAISREGEAESPAVVV